MCEHCYYFRGIRTFGDNIPSFAQGSYLPGDEPGDRCDITEGMCDPDDPELCPKLEDK